MDVTDASPQRLALAIERFLVGETIVYCDVSFCKFRNSSLQVCCFSDWAPERCTPDHASVKIDRAKAVLEDLKCQIASFRESVESLPVEYFFCYDPGKGAVVLAKEINGQFEWLANT
jgi:hypothetical protein